MIRHVFATRASFSTSSEGRSGLQRLQGHPFSGSGTTLLAAHQLERIGYGCELDPGYAAVALQRLADIGLKPDLVQEAPEAAREPEAGPEATRTRMGPMARHKAAVAAPGPGSAAARSATVRSGCAAIAATSRCARCRGVCGCGGVIEVASAARRGSESEGVAAIISWQFPII